eukprot:816910-Prymnesium_polylepis.1
MDRVYIGPRSTYPSRRSPRRGTRPSCTSNRDACFSALDIRCRRFRGTCQSRARSTPCAGTTTTAHYLRHTPVRLGHTCTLRHSIDGRWRELASKPHRLGMTSRLPRPSPLVELFLSPEARASARGTQVARERAVCAGSLTLTSAREGSRKSSR